MGDMAERAQDLEETLRPCVGCGVEIDCWDLVKCSHCGHEDACQFCGACQTGEDNG